VRTLVSRRFGARLSGPLLYLAVAIGSGFSAYWTVFTQFAAYDDFGFYTHSLRLFSEGEALYDQVWTGYGPFFYELWTAVFGLAGQTFSTDSGGVAFVILWLVTSLVLGVSCQRLTGRLAIGVIVQLLSFTLLRELAVEPMSANGLVCLLLALSVAVVSFLLPRRPRAALVTLGALVAALALTKINVGAYAAAAVVYAMVIALPAFRRNSALRWAASLALVAVGPVVISRNLAHTWGQRYAVLVAASALAIVLTVEIPKPRDAADDVNARRWVTWLLSGFAACAIVVVGIILGLGTSLSAFLQETVLVPFHLTRAFTLPLRLRAAGVPWALGMVAAAWIVRRIRARSPQKHPGVLGAVGRIAVALVIWFSIVGYPVAFRVTFVLAVALAWVAAIPSSRDDERVQTRFARVLLPALAVLQTMIAYPVAGSQVLFGALLPLVCGAVCFADGLSDLEMWQAARRTHARGRYAPRTTGALTVAIAIFLSLHYVVLPSDGLHDRYNENRALPFAGASRLHLPAERVEGLASVVALLRQHCSSVVSMPGMYSFNLWSERPTPSGLAAEPFWNLLTHLQEHTALARARAAHGLCAVYSYPLTQFWDNGAPLPQTPLVKFIEFHFTTIGVFLGTYAVRVRSS
jgi:hypothetical protein